MEAEAALLDVIESLSPKLLDGVAERLSAGPEAVGEGAVLLEEEEAAEPGKALVLSDETEPVPEGILVPSDGETLLSREEIVELRIAVPVSEGAVAEPEIVSVIPGAFAVLFEGFFTT